MCSRRLRGLLGRCALLREIVLHARRRRRVVEVRGRVRQRRAGIDLLFCRNLGRMRALEGRGKGRERRRGLTETRRQVRERTRRVVLAIAMIRLLTIGGARSRDNALKLLLVQARKDRADVLLNARLRGSSGTATRVGTRVRRVTGRGGIGVRGRVVHVRMRWFVLCSLSCSVRRRHGVVRGPSRLGSTKRVEF